eukprot:GHVR01107003.1.p1 GENE.GHVR01107003.1~~GHVR01107003.1.p1  ORF type:complete len:222 (+),score=54.16 GHVR01107003.1:712-1377(+)
MSAKYVQKQIIKNTSVEAEKTLAVRKLQEIESDYVNDVTAFSKTVEDDLWSGLFTVYEICHPETTFESFISENTTEGEKVCSDLSKYDINKSVCLKSLFYNNESKVKLNGVIIYDYKYEGVSFYDFFNFEEACTFDGEVEVDEKVYLNTEEEDSSMNIKGLKENFEMYLTLAKHNIHNNNLYKYIKEIRQQETNKASVLKMRKYKNNQGEGDGDRDTVDTS